MKYLSLFSGIGGFELGIKLTYEKTKNSRVVGNSSKANTLPRRQKAEHGAGMGNKQGERPSNDPDEPEAIGFSEIDKYATAIYQSHFPKHKAYGDITKINADELPDFDLLCGGFPCQSFSIAGKRGGFSDTQGTMFFEIARILKAKHPRLLLLENVKGLLSHDQGRTFATIISTLDELGYDLQWQVLNSKNFGVPQNRERVFIIGHLRGTSRPEVFPFFGGERESIGETNEQRSASTLTGRSAGGQNRRGNYISNEPIVLNQGGVPDLDDPKWRETYSIRRLTPVECERLQGFPDNWTRGISDTQRYKCCGNAVTVNVIKAIMEKLLG